MKECVIVLILKYVIYRVRSKKEVEMTENVQGYSQLLARFDRGWLRLSLGYFQKINALQSILAYSSTLFDNFCIRYFIFRIQNINQQDSSPPF